MITCWGQGVGVRWVLDKDDPQFYIVGQDIEVEVTTIIDLV